MKIIPYLSFSGDCREAFAFYERVLDGTILDMITHGDTPEGEGAGAHWSDKIMNAHMRAGEYELMGADTPPEYAQPGGGFSLSLHFEDPARARSVYDALSEGGEQTMPFASTSWSPGFGMTRDRFGVHWMVNVVPQA
ncbi:VOC family protein [Pelagibacterium montanilacus]|uniref:VOC family protein n=1 Tax=Pelagibacterium montanilacus TaxID=2185280 RepID=UPI000F8F690C|nr:VOC family protein [Pelagibacterium montanilacus]